MKCQVLRSLWLLRVLVLVACGWRKRRLIDENEGEEPFYALCRCHGALVGGWWLIAGLKPQAQASISRTVTAIVVVVPCTVISLSAFRDSARPPLSALMLMPIWYQLSELAIHIRDQPGRAC